MKCDPPDLMRVVELNRTETSDEGTFGMLQLDDGSVFASGELPWRENAAGTSCIAPGQFKCEWLFSPKHGWCYHLTGVPGRSAVEIHSANWMGDKAKGYRCQLEGCIAPGLTVGTLEGQKAVISSRTALAEFEKKLAQQPFILVVSDLPPQTPAVERKIA